MYIVNTISAVMTFLIIDPGRLRICPWLLQEGRKTSGHVLLSRHGQPKTMYLIFPFRFPLPLIPLLPFFLLQTLSL